MARTLDIEARVARDRITDSLVGLVALGVLYGLTFFFLHPPLALALMGVWLGWVVLGFVLRERNPHLVRRLNYFSVGSWVVLVLVLNVAGIS